MKTTGLVFSICWTTQYLPVNSLKDRLAMTLMPTINYDSLLTEL